MPTTWKYYGRVTLTGTRLQVTPGKWIPIQTMGEPEFDSIPMPPLSKWMPCIWVDGKLIYGSVPTVWGQAGGYSPTHTYEGELPYYGGQLDLEGTWPPGEEPPPLPSDGTDLITSSGAFTTSGSGVDYDKLVAHGYDWVSFQAVNGASVNDIDLTEAKAAGFGDGFGVGVWGVVYSKSDFYDFGARLGAQAVALGAEHVIVDAEECYKDTRGTLSGQQIIDGLRAAGWTGPVHLSTLSNPVDPAHHDFGMDTESFTKTGGGIMPQVYPNEFPTANYTATAAREYWLRMGVPASQLNMSIGTYEGVAPMTGEEWVEHLQAGQVGANFNLFLAESTDDDELDALDELTGMTTPPPVPPPAKEGGGLRIPEDASVIEVHIYAGAHIIYGGEDAWDWGHFDAVDNGLPMEIRLAPPGKELPPVEDVLPMAWGFFNELAEHDTYTKLRPNFTIHGKSYVGPNVGMQLLILHGPTTVHGIQIWLPEDQIGDEVTAMLWWGAGPVEPGVADYPFRQKTQIVTAGFEGNGWNNFWFDEDDVFTVGSAPFVIQAITVGWGAGDVEVFGTDEVLFTEYFPAHAKGYYHSNFPAFSFLEQRWGIGDVDVVPSHRPYYAYTGGGYIPCGPILTFVPGPYKAAVPEPDDPPGPPDISPPGGPFRGIDISFTENALDVPDWTQVDDVGIERQYPHPINAQDLKGGPG